MSLGDASEMRSTGLKHLPLLILMVDGVRYFVLRLRSPTALAAENLFLRKQLALY
jgi:hypothetical protein